MKKPLKFKLKLPTRVTGTKYVWIFEDMESAASNAEYLCSSGTSLEKFVTISPAPPIPTHTFYRICVQNTIWFHYTQNASTPESCGIATLFPSLCSIGSESSGK